MAVLIALTVGVVLGAGPLQGKLTESLDSQITHLSKRQTDLNTENEFLKTELTSRNNYLSEMADSTLKGRLEGTKIAIVRIYDTQEADVKDTEAFLEKAGARKVSDVTLNDNWFNEKKSGLRSQIVEQMRSHFEQSPPADASVEHILMSGLHDMLFASGDKVQNLAGLLTSKTNPLVNVTLAPEEPADALVVIFNRRHITNDGEQRQKPDKPLPSQAVIAIAREAEGWETPAVFVGEAESQEDEIAVIRNEGIAVSTVDRVGRIMALISTPLALVQEKNKNHIAIGFDSGSTHKMPPIDDSLLPQPTPSPEASEGDNQ